MFLGLESNVSVRARLNPFTGHLFVAATLLNEARPRVSRLPLEANHDRVAIVSLYPV